ncbi:MAG: protein-export chaperone SecB [Holosporaceae bacterium]|jgi:preprotein translocase subunit SecB|nr:protein-export chaperone SecB [Holosporaceae bacterium]
MTEKNRHNLAILSQYVKDLSFENINSLSQVESSDKQPQIDVQVKVDVEKDDKPNVYFISLVIEINAQLNKPLFILELDYTGEFLVEGFPDDLINIILYVECPRLLFPFARCIVANAAIDGGFPPLYLAPLNFMEMYLQQMEANRGQAPNNE